MREIRYDQFKSPSQIKRDVGKCCIIPGCGEDLTTYLGPGSDSLCRKHQTEQIEYGKVGRISRPHTFHRNSNFVCDDCGWSILDDDRLKSIEDEMAKRQIARILLHGDHHHVRKADGGEDTAENIRSLCVVCHAKKTVLNKDNRRGTVDVDK
jgi:5-methylcytosine-specific restriction endonuclease McrA